MLYYTSLPSEFVLEMQFRIYFMMTGLQWRTKDPVRNWPSFLHEYSLNKVNGLRVFSMFLPKVNRFSKHNYSGEAPG